MHFCKKGALSKTTNKVFANILQRQQNEARELPSH